jgi:hypothetical protein
MSAVNFQPLRPSYSRSHNKLFLSGAISTLIYELIMLLLLLLLLSKNRR